MQIFDLIKDNDQYDSDFLSAILANTQSYNYSFAEKLYKNSNFLIGKIGSLLSQTRKHSVSLSEKLCYSPEYISKLNKQLVNFFLKHFNETKEETNNE